MKGSIVGGPIARPPTPFELALREERSRAFWKFIRDYDKRQAKAGAETNHLTRRATRAVQPKKT